MLFAISFSTCNRVGKRTAWILIRLRRLVWIHAGGKPIMFVLSWRGKTLQIRTLPNGSEEEPPEVVVSLVVVTLEPSALMMVSSTIVFVTPPNLQIR
jgi:hypothetical protein